MSTCCRWVMVLCSVVGMVAPSGASVDNEIVPAKIVVHINERAEIDTLTRLMSIEDARGLEVVGYATPSQLAALTDSGYQWRRIAEEKVSVAATMCPPGWESDLNRSYGCYPSYSQYVAFLQGYAASYPDLCSVESIGATTNLGRPHDLWVMKISDNPADEEDEPEVFLTSSMHGDETTGYVLMLMLIDELLSGYGTEPELRALVDELEIWINPLANPDGTYRQSDATVDGAIRSYTMTSGSSSGVDPNRNFPDPADGDHPDGYPWWQETQAMMAFAFAHSFALSVNFHGGSEVVNYPWDTWARRHADDAWLIDISRAYADLAHADSPAGYMTDLNNGITNGYDWYRVAGGRQDYMSYWHGCREVTIEISRTKLLPASQLEDHWTYNRRAVLGFMAQAREGVRGRVTSADGQPLDAVVEVVGHDVAQDRSWVYTDPDVGDYHRMLLPDTYTLRFSAYGHGSVEVDDIVVSSGPARVVDVTLYPLPRFSISGQVTTPATRLPIEGAMVEVLGAQLEPAITGSDGSFVLDGVSEGAQDFRVSAEGYDSIEVQRTIDATYTVLSFTLSPANVEIFLYLASSSPHVDK